jgi:hypothetical protein
VGKKRHRWFGGHVREIARYIFTGGVQPGVATIAMRRALLWIPSRGSFA